MRLKFALAASILFTTGLSVSARTSGTDSFGYRYKDHLEPEVVHSWVEHTTNSREALPPSTEVGTFELDAPVTIYGYTAIELAISGNGYLSTNLADPGTDRTPDCNLSQPPSTGSGNRIYALHTGTLDDNHDGAQYEYFPVSPHPHHSGGVHVITWQGMRILGSAEFEFQVLLFDNTDIMVQTNGLPVADSEATIGIQDLLAGVGAPGASALIYRCEVGFDLAANTAVLFEMPTLTVTTQSDVSNAGDGQTTLREAVGLLPNGGKITFSTGMNARTISLGSDLILTDAISIDASNLTDGVIISNGPGAQHRVIAEDHAQFLNMEFTAMHACITGLGASAVFVGDCVFNLNSWVAISSSSAVVAHATSFTGNEHGGIIASESTRTIAPILRITDCQFSLNESVIEGGGLYVFGDFDVQIDDSSFVSNSSYGAGGAISVYFADEFNVNGCSFNFNTAECGANLSAVTDEQIGGGAIFGYDTTMRIDRCSFRGNEAEEHREFATDAFINRGAGAVHSNSGVCYLTNSSFEDNSNGTVEVNNSQLVINTCSIVDGTGDFAIEVNGANAELYLNHSLIKGNRSDVTAMAGVHVGTGSVYLAISGNIFADNMGFLRDDHIEWVATASLFSRSGHNIFDNNQLGFDPAEGNLINTDPMLGTFDNHGGPTRVYSLLPGSPALDAGSTLPSAGVDQRGYPRPAGGSPGASPRFDIGPFEYQGNVQVTTGIDEDVVPGEGVSLREALSTVVEGGTITFWLGLNGDPIMSSETAPFLPEIPAGVTIDASALPERVRFQNERTLSTPLTGEPNIFRGIIFEREHVVSIAPVEYYDCDFLGVPRSAVLAMDDVRMERCLIKESEGLEIRDQITPDSAVVNIVDCHFIDVFGGPAIDCSDPDTELNLTGTVIDGTQTNSKAPVRILKGSIVLKSTTIANSESGGEAGAIFIEQSGRLSLSNSTISRNSLAVAGGGAITIGEVEAEIAHSTIFCNSFDRDAGAIFAIGRSTVNLDHTIIAANYDRDRLTVRNFSDPRIVVSEGHNLIDTRDELNAEATDIVGRKPHLAPLGYYSPDPDNLMLVHALLAASPAIDGGSSTNGGPSVDQRGAPRLQNGDGAGGSRVDIGSFEASPPRIVTNTDNSGTGSLRNEITLAPAGGRVLFDPSLDGEWITLSSQILIPESVQVDATSLPGGITLNGNLATRVLRMNENAHLAMHAINIRGGSTGANSGGAGFRQVQGQSLFSNCSISQNSGDAGAGMYIEGGSCYLQNCTVANNTGTGIGSAIHFRPGTTGRIEHCTMANNVSGSRGNVVLTTAKVKTRFSIFARNTVGAGAVLDNFSWDGSFTGQLVSLGYNATDDSALGGVFDEPGDVHNTTLTLGALADNGGWSLTMATSDPNLVDVVPKELSLPHPTFDARGFARRAGEGLAKDIGAYEKDGDTQDSDRDGMPDWWECYFGLNPLSAADASEDPDGDGEDNRDEFLNGNHPFRFNTDPSALPIIFNVRPYPGGFAFDYIGPAGQRFVSQSSSDLKTWWDGFPTTTTGGVQSFFAMPGSVRRYYRFRRE